MNEVTTVGLDLAKRVFQVHGADAKGRPVLQKKLRREEVLSFFACCRLVLSAWKHVHHRITGHARFARLAMTPR
ncbi:hypothetical protein H8B02_17585 [Bradyrhizobium sp. Pear77]|uniref:hypothetical protein n=1 Tax=Bradyrhizobium TaxID=374 RepID=UPI001E649EA6|nr:hypothetical protein [Bradyrhizobium altum]MCC8955186.1 hypothetical protein [Bradyrhizobium altum]MCC8968772.1 hypothetical protein [Bradyrhizobium oropedii]